MSNRSDEWLFFHYDVLQHINNYTIPQYGDAPDDPIEEYSIEICQKLIGRYVNRIGKNLRGEKEAIRDMYKIAHIACVLCNKIKAKYAKDPPDTPK